MSQVDRRNPVGIVPTEGCRIAEGKRSAGSYPHAAVGSAEVFDRHDAGVLEREECGAYSSRVDEERGTLFGRSFWSRGYCMSTVGLDEALIRRYIQEQEKDERDQERGLFDDHE